MRSMGRSRVSGPRHRGHSHSQQMSLPAPHPQPLSPGLVFTPPGAAPERNTQGRVWSRSSASGAQVRTSTGSEPAQGPVLRGAWMRHALPRPHMEEGH